MKKTNKTPPWGKEPLWKPLEAMGPKEFDTHIRLIAAWEAAAKKPSSQKLLFDGTLGLPVLSREQRALLPIPEGYECFLHRDTGIALCNQMAGAAPFVPVGKEDWDRYSRNCCGEYTRDYGDYWLVSDHWVRAETLYHQDAGEYIRPWSGSQWYLELFCFFCPQEEGPETGGYLCKQVPAPAIC